MPTFFDVVYYWWFSFHHFIFIDWGVFSWVISRHFLSFLRLMWCFLSSSSLMIFFDAARFRHADYFPMWASMMRIVEFVFSLFIIYFLFDYASSFHFPSLFRYFHFFFFSTSLFHHFDDAVSSISRAFSLRRSSFFIFAVFVLRYYFHISPFYYFSLDYFDGWLIASFIFDDYFLFFIIYAADAWCVVVFISSDIFSSSYFFPLLSMISLRGKCRVIFISFDYAFIIITILLLLQQKDYYYFISSSLLLFRTLLLFHICTLFHFHFISFIIITFHVISTFSFHFIER